MGGCTPLNAGLLFAFLASVDAADATAPPDGGVIDAGRLAVPDRPADDVADAGAADAGATPVPAEGKPPRPIEGEVFIKGKRKALAGAQVWLDGAPAAETDAHGRFRIDAPRGRHRVQVWDTGFEQGDQNLEVGDRTPALTFRLEPNEEGRYETVIHAKKPPQAPSVALTKEELTQIPGTLGDPFRAIETLPGVAPVAWPFPVYVVRGTNPGNTGYFLEGVRLPALFHFALGPPVVHPYLIDSVEFYPGGYPARYGRFVGGAVVGTTRPPPADMAHGSADVRLIDATVMASTPFNSGKGTVVVAGRYSYTATLFSLLNSSVDLAYSDAQLRIDHALGAGRLTLFALASSDALTPKDPADSNERLRMRFGHTLLRFVAPVGPGQMGLAVASGVDSTRAPFQDNALSVTSYSVKPRLWYQAAIGRSVDFEIGGDAENTWYRPQVAQPNPAFGDLASKRSVFLMGGYAAMTLKLGSRLVLVPAFREDLYVEGGASVASAGPRISARIRVGEAIWLKATAGRYSQLPNLPLQVAGFEGFGLATYGLQTAWQSAVGAEAKLPLALSLEATGYVQRSVLTDVRDPDAGDYLLDDYLVRRQALAYGMELMLRRPISSRLYGWLAYTLSRSLRQFEGGSVGPSDWDQRHILNLVVGYRFGAFTIGGRVHLNTGRPAKIDGRLPAEYGRLPPFYQIDLRAERRFLFDGFTLYLYAEVINATLTRQVTGLRQDATGIGESGFTIAIPSIGLRGEI